ncbi:hypothetical protein IBX65_08405 [Candidatus Aerophobetes bacterium]|nr:hypothetical protein [Candidatus Aerophobetes bacterium]
MEALALHVPRKMMISANAGKEIMSETMLTERRIMIKVEKSLRDVFQSIEY